MTMQETAMSVLLSDTIAKFDHRLAELRGAVDEFTELKSARDRLAGRSGVRPERPSARVGSTHGSRGRPRGSGSRRGEVLAILTENPGWTTNQIASKMGIKANYLYRILPGLVSDGEIVKDGNEYFVAGASDPVPESTEGK